MELGAFSISLTVKDIEVSKTFYEKLGFEFFGGDISQNWVILKNGSTVIGLFQGMFEKNSLTFNPGWTSDAQELDVSTDVRELQRQLKAQGVESLPRPTRTPPDRRASSWWTPMGTRYSSINTFDSLTDVDATHPRHPQPVREGQARGTRCSHLRTGPGPEPGRPMLDDPGDGLRVDPARPAM
jgi:hypothetical protein